MKKIYGAVILAFLVISMINIASAYTLVAGKIYNSDFSATVAGASVDITCNLASNSTTSLTDGSYAVKFANADCDNNDIVFVHAIKAGVGENTVNASVHDYSALVPSLNLAVANVPLIPEFGVVVGIITVIGALSVFFVVRRK